jgi:DNA helicase-2/ATP-dependent DNA helicase PcrA
VPGQAVPGQAASGAGVPGPAVPATRGLGASVPGLATPAPSGASVPSPAVPGQAASGAGVPSPAVPGQAASGARVPSPVVPGQAASGAGVPSPAHTGASAPGARVADTGQVTLMTVHTAKGLEFPVVFVTGLEDGTFPHRRSAGSEDEMAEERRLAYVALTRARERLYISRAEARTTFGRPEYYPESRFVSDIPAEVLDWRRDKGSTGALQAEARGASMSGRAPNRFARPKAPGQARADGRPAFGSATPRPASEIPNLAAGDMVTHDAYGLGHVLAVEGSPPNQTARIEFRDEGVKRLLLRFAPVTKL